MKNPPPPADDQASPAGIRARLTAVQGLQGIDRALLRLLALAGQP